MLGGRADTCAQTPAHKSPFSSLSLTVPASQGEGSQSLSSHCVHSSLKSPWAPAESAFLKNCIPRRQSTWIHGTEHERALVIHSKTKLQLRAVLLESPKPLHSGLTANLYFCAKSHPFQWDDCLLLTFRPVFCLPAYSL